MLWDDFETYLRQEETIKAVFRLKKCPPWISDPSDYVPGSEFICVSYLDRRSLTMRCLANGYQINAGAGYFEFVGMRSVQCQRREGVKLG